MWLQACVNLVGTLFLENFTRILPIENTLDLASNSLTPMDALFSLDENALESTYQLAMPQKFKSISN